MVHGDGSEVVADLDCCNPLAVHINEKALFFCKSVEGKHGILFQTSFIYFSINYYSNNSPFLLGFLQSVN